MEQQLEIQEGFAEVNGARLYYQVAGHGHPLVLLHAGVADHTMWDRQFSQFALKYRTIRYDLRGFGQSLMPPGSFMTHEDLDGLLRFLDVERVYLVGVSMGGSTVIDYTLTYPEKVAALVAVAAGIVESSEESKREYARLDEAYEARDVERVLELEMQLWLAGPRRDLTSIAPELKEHFSRMERANLLREFQGEEGKQERLDPRAIERLHEIAAPTFVIAGDEDLPEVLASADLIAERVAGAEKVISPNVAHMVPMEVPEEFNRLVLQFLARCDVLT